MNTNHLLSFLVLAETNSYQKVSERLHYSRSTVMEHIRSLEQELGTALVSTHDRKLFLTPAGERFRIHAQSMMQIYQNALTDVLETTSNPQLRIITCETLGLYFLNTPLSRLISSHPDIDLSVQFNPDNDIQKRLENDEADIAVQFSGHIWDTVPNTNLKRTYLCTDEAVFFSNPDSWIATKENPSIQDIAQTKFILTVKGGIYNSHLSHIFKETGIHVTPSQYIDSGSLLKQFVKKHDCISMVSRRVIENELASGELVEIPLCREKLLSNVVATYPTRLEKNSALKDFIRLTVNHLK